MARLRSTPLTRLPGHHWLLPVMVVLVLIGRILSPVGGSIMAAVLADDHPVFLTSELCLTMPMQSGYGQTGYGLSDDGNGSSMTSAHDCCWWMCGVSLLAVLVVAAGLVLFGAVVRPTRHEPPVPLPRAVWRRSHPPRAPPLGCLSA